MGVTLGGSDECGDNSQRAVDPEMVLRAECAVLGCGMASVRTARLLQHSTVLLLLCPVQRAARALHSREPSLAPAVLTEAVKGIYELLDSHPFHPSPFSSSSSFDSRVASLDISDAARETVAALCGEVASVVRGAPAVGGEAVPLQDLHNYLTELDAVTAILGNSFIIRDAPVGSLIPHRPNTATSPLYRVVMQRGLTRRYVEAHQLFVERLVLSELEHQLGDAKWCQQPALTVLNESCRDAQVQHHSHRQLCLPRQVSLLPSTRHSVVVVGAGAAALGVLLSLNAAGVSDILVLEGGNRVGGRVHSLYPQLREDAPVELGAQWIHGQTGNVLHDLLVKGRRPLVSEDYSVDGLGHFFTSAGEELDPSMAEEVWAFFEAREKVLDTMIVPTALPGGQEASPTSAVPRHQVADVQTVFGFKEHFEREVLRRVTDPQQRRLYTALYNWCIKWYLADNACDRLSQLAAAHWGRYQFCSGHYNVNPRRGMTEALMELYRGTRAQIRLETRVLRLSYASEVLPRNGRLVAADGRPAVAVTCSDGSVVGADAVVVTPSVGVLQAERALFQPPLPAPLSTALYSMGYGTLDKIILEYREAWWRQYDGRSLQLVWLPEEDPPPHQWEAYVTGFDVTYGALPRLTGWVSGPGTEAMERCSEGEVAARCTRLLRRFLGREDIPPPSRVYRSQWGRHPLFKGSYAHPSVEFEARGCTPAHLSTPVTARLPDHRTQVPILALAGEALSLHHFSTVHGALETGLHQGCLLLPGRRLADMSMTRSKL